MMNSLEKDIGFPVLLRGRQGVRLTPAGERIFPLIRNLLAADEALGREIGRINTNREETVRIAAYSSIAIHWLPFRSKYSKSMATDKICASGLAIFKPFACGQEPWIGSNTGVLSPVEAEGSNPIEPLMQEPSSVKISPNVFSVTITSKNFGS